MNKVTIIGGGIAGIEAAIYYRKAGFEVELISDRPYLFIYPIAIWIPVEINKFADVAFPIEKLAKRHKFSLTVDKIIAINAQARSITLKSGGERVIEHLVIAIGAGKMPHQGIEHTFSICGDPEQSLLLKEKIAELVKRGSGKIAFGFGGNPNDPSAMRGGPGFEMFFNLHHHLTKLGIRNQFDLTFFAPMPEPGARMGKKALELMAMLFKRNNFNARYGKKITRFEADGVVFEGGSKLESNLTMFIPAGNGLAVIKDSGLPLNKAGFICINDFCEVAGVEGWYCIGDAAALEGPDWKAKQGHLAEIMARSAAHNSAVTLGLKSGIKQGYREHISILCVMDMGNGAGFVYRDDKKQMLIPLPIIGHWLKILWGWYYKMSKMRYIPRIPGI